MLTGNHKKLAYSIDELTHLIGIGKSYIYEEIKSGNLKKVKIGKRSLFLAEDVDGYLKRMRAASPQSVG